MMQNEINIDLKTKKYKMENAELNYEMNERRKKWVENIVQKGQKCNT